MESPSDNNFITEWWFKDSVGRDQRILLRVDENSSPDDIEREMEYWYTQYSSLPSCNDKKAIMAAYQWMSALLEA